MRIPRDISGAKLTKSLEALGYKVTRQVGSHMRLTTSLGGQHHVTVPNHNPIRVGTLSAILGRIAQHHQMEKADLIKHSLDSIFL